MSTFKGLRLIVQVIAALVLLAGIALVAAGVLTSQWQWYEENVGGRPEVHQHGLWIDCTWAPTDTSGSGAPIWTCKYKFDEAVYGDEVHRAKDYQINTLVLLCMGIVLSCAGLFFSCCAGLWTFAVVGWLLSCLLATVLSGAAVAYFFVMCMNPNYRYVQTYKRNEQLVGSSFYFAVIGTGMYAVDTMLAICCAILVFLNARVTHNSGRTYPKKTFHRGENTTAV